MLKFCTASITCKLPTQGGWQNPPNPNPPGVKEGSLFPLSFPPYNPPYLTPISLQETTEQNIPARVRMREGFPRRGSTKV